jgi:hypothetical protein
VKKESIGVGITCSLALLCPKSQFSPILNFIIYGHVVLVVV